MINNPIIRKELLTSLRTRKALAMQTIFLLASGLLLWVLWPEGGMQAVGDRQAAKILSTLAIGELFMVALFAPTFTAASLTMESEHNTLESLFATTLKPWEIAIGKMVGSLGFLMLLIVSGVPVLGAAFLLGGITIGQVVAVVGVLVMTGIYLGLIGMLVSTFMHRSYRAIIVAYAILMGIMGSAIIAWPQSGNIMALAGEPWNSVLHVVASLSPIQAMMSVVLSESEYVKPAVGMPPFWQVFLVLSAIISIFAAVAVMFKLRHPVPPPRPREKMKVVERGISARSFFFLIDPRKRRRMIMWWQNPILVKEFRSRPMLQTHWLFRAISLTLIVSLLLVFLVSLSVQALVGQGGDMIGKMIVAVAALMVVLVVFIGPAMSGGALCGDRETGVWDLIRATRISSWRIVTGKFQASVIPLLLLTIATLPSLGIMVYFRIESTMAVVKPLAVVGMTIAFVSSAGMFFSGLCSKTSVASAWTYAVMIGITMGSLLVLLAGDAMSDWFIRCILLVNPVAAAMDAAESPAMDGYNLWIPHLKIMAVATIAMMFVSIVRVYQLRRAN